MSKKPNSTSSLTILLAASCRVLFIPTHHRKIYCHMSVLFLIYVIRYFMFASLSSQFATNEASDTLQLQKYIHHKVC